jgi:hypothetical protein
MMRRPGFAVRVLIILAALIPCAVGSARPEDRVNLQTRPGATQPLYLTKPATAPVASLVLFPGGDGRQPQHYGPPDLKHGNFLVRSRGLFVQQGFTVAVLDVPSDQTSGMHAFRLSPEHRTDIAAVIAYLRQQAAVPVWLVGTSMGTISAANGARLTSGGPDGIVLTSSILRPSEMLNGSVYDAASGVKVPTLFVHNKDDACKVCPYGELSSLMSKFTVPRKELIAFEGGDPPISDPCEALSRHGYIGLEPQVVAAIAGWIKAGKP